MNTFVRVIISFLFFVGQNLSAQKIDSLQNVLKTSKEDTNKVKTLNTLASLSINNGSLDVALQYANDAKVLAQTLAFKKGEANAYSKIGLVYYSKGNYADALKNQLENLKCSEKLQNKLLIANAYNDIANIYDAQGDYHNAIKFYSQSLELRKQLNDKAGIAQSYNNIGTTYDYNGKFDEALDSYNKSLKINLELKNNEEIAKNYGNIGYVYQELTDYDKALEYYKKSIIIDEQFGYLEGASAGYLNLGEMYYLQKKYKIAKEYYDKALKIAKELGQKDYLKIGYFIVTKLDSALGDYKSVYRNYKNFIIYRDSLNNEETTKQTLKEQYKYDLEKKEAAAKAEQDKKDAVAVAESRRQRLYFWLIAIAGGGVTVVAFLIFRSLRQKKKSNEIISMQNKELEKLSIVASNSENTVIICNTDTEMIWANDSFTRTFGYTLEELKKERGKTVVEISSNPDIKKIIAECIEKKSGISYESKNSTRYKGERWFQTTLSPVFEENGKLKNIIFIDSDITELKTIGLELHHKNKEIIDSITYAKRLQQAILPAREEVKSYLPESFLFYNPKDIVAGDFYWMHTDEKSIYIAAADCTGHGVPGAMVSVVCSNALNRAIKEFALTETGEILDKVRELVIETFEKSDKDVKDGMDISLLRLDIQDAGNISGTNAQWSGANNSLWYFQNKVLSEIKANKQPIGKYSNPIPFTSHLFVVESATSFYLFSDGYSDQFGENDKKFMSKRFKESLLSIQDLPMQEQGQLVEKFHVDWKGATEQTDDVLVIGIKV